MNKDRRNKIDLLRSRLEEIMEQINELAEEERDAFDNLPESIQESERGENMENAFDNLDSAVASIEEAVDYLTEAAC